MVKQVSVITAVYNGARTIAQSVESILAQELEDWELIIVDDGSTDDTHAKLRAYSDPRIRIYRQTNAGRSAARNRGIELSEGEVLLFLDADDWLLPSALYEHVNFLNANPEFGACVSDGYFCSDDGSRIVTFSERRGEVVSGNVFDRIVVDPGLSGALHAICLRRSAIEYPKTRFDPNLVIGEDWDFFIRIASRMAFGFIDAITCVYRWYPENTTRSATPAYRREQLWMGRQKVLQSPIFELISPATKEIFLYQVLIDLLQGMPGAQEEVLTSPKFQDLPRDAKVSAICCRA